MTLSISLLGPLAVAGPDGIIAVGGRRQRAALAALAWSAGEVVSVDRLTEAVWGDEPPPASAKIVQNLVLQLRKSLGRQLIERCPPGYVLHGWHVRYMTPRLKRRTCSASPTRTCT